MPQESSNTSSTGQLRTSSSRMGAAQAEEDISTIPVFAPTPVLGASQRFSTFETGAAAIGVSQGAVVSETRGDSDGPGGVPALTGATIRPQPKLAIRRGRNSSLRTHQLWEGTVIEARERGFVARLTDRTNPDNPDEQALFDYDEISPEDRNLLRPGSTFYWIIGNEKTPGGQVKNVSIVQMRRLPGWTRSALARAARRAQQAREELRAAE